MPHLFTLTTTGHILNIYGIEMTRIKDTYNIGEWLLDFRAAYGKPIEGEIIREADIWAWEAATVRRAKGKADREAAARHLDLQLAVLGVDIPRG